MNDLMNLCCLVENPLCPAISIATWLGSCVTSSNLIENLSVSHFICICAVFPPTRHTHTPTRTQNHTPTPTHKHIGQSILYVFQFASLTFLVHLNGRSLCVTLIVPTISPSAHLTNIEPKTIDQKLLLFSNLSAK